MRGALNLLLALLLASNCGGDLDRRENEPRDPETGCVPSFRDLKDSYIHTYVGTWTIRYKAYVIGCRDDLMPLQEETLAEFVRELEDPSEWQPFAMWSGKDSPQLRAKMTHEFNEIAEAEIATDVLITCMRITDALRAPD